MKKKYEDAMVVKDGYKVLKQVPCQTLCSPEGEMESAQETMSKDEEQD